MNVCHQYYKLQTGLRSFLKFCAVCQTTNLLYCYQNTLTNWLIVHGTGKITKKKTPEIFCCMALGAILLRHGNKILSAPIRINTYLQKTIWLHKQSFRQRETQSQYLYCITQYLWFGSIEIPITACTLKQHSWAKGTECITLVEGLL